MAEEINREKLEAALMHLEARCRNNKRNLQALRDQLALDLPKFDERLNGLAARGGPMLGIRIKAAEAELKRQEAAIVECHDSLAKRVADLEKKEADYILWAHIVEKRGDAHDERITQLENLAQSRDAGGRAFEISLVHNIGKRRNAAVRFFKTREGARKYISAYNLTNWEMFERGDKVEWQYEENASVSEEAWAGLAKTVESFAPRVTEAVEAAVKKAAEEIRAGVPPKGPSLPRGLEVLVREDGVWLSFRNEEGASAAVNAEDLANKYGADMIGRAIRVWAKKLMEEKNNG